MIIKGKTSTGRGLGAYLLQDKNDRIEQWRIRGDLQRDLKDTLDDWRSDSIGTRCTKPLYHVQLNPDRKLSREEWGKAIQIFEQEMGLQKQPRTIVLHEYKGREHLHLVYSRINEHGQAISDSWNYLHHEKAARKIEKELGLEKTQGVFIDRQGKRPERTPSHAAIQQSKQTDKTPYQIKAEVSALYNSAKKNGTIFITELNHKGYTLAKGNSRNYVILDKTGVVHSLCRAARIKVAELCETLKDFPLQRLPSVKQVRKTLEETKELDLEELAEQIEIQTVEPELAKDLEITKSQTLDETLEASNPAELDEKQIEKTNDITNSDTQELIHSEKELAIDLEPFSEDKDIEPALEQQKAIKPEQDKHEKRRQELKEARKRGDEERAKKKELGLDRSRSRGRSL